MNLLREMSKASISVQLAQRLVRQRQMTANHHLCDKYSDEAKSFSVKLLKTSQAAYHLVRASLDKLMPHPGLVRKWIHQVISKKKIFYDL
jgi:hypothetical protein